MVPHTFQITFDPIAIWISLKILQKKKLLNKKLCNAKNEMFL